MEQYQINLEFLKQYAPVLYNTFTQDMQIYEYRIENKENGYFQLGFENKKCWINSIYNIEEELKETFIDKDFDAEVLILIGLGNGKAIQYIKDNFKNTKAVFIIEPYMMVFEEYLYHNDLKSVFKDMGEISFVLNKNESDAAELLIKILSDMQHTRIEIVSQISYKLLNSNYVEVFKERVLRGFRSKVVQLVTLDRTKYKWLNNTILNMRSPFGLQQEIAPFLKGKPGIIVGAGPSLNKNIGLLNDIKDKAVTIAASSAIKILNSNNIKPDIKMVIDAYQDKSIYDEMFFSKDEEGPLLYASQAFDEAVYDYSGPKYFMLLPTDAFGAYIMNKAGQPLEFVSSGASVVQSAFSFLAQAGCDPIILLGQDMCFYDNKLYASGINSMDQSSFDSSEYIKMYDIYGNEVYTVRNYLQIKYDYETLVKRYPDVRVINATEGGLGIEGVPNMSLATVIQQELKHTFEDSFENFVKKSKSYAGKQSIDVLSALSVALSEVEEVLSINEERIEYLKKFEKKIEKSKINKLLNDFEYIDKSLIPQLDHNEFYASVIKNNIAIQTIALKQFYDTRNKDPQTKITSGLKYYYGLFSEIDIFATVCKDWIEDYFNFMKDNNLEEGMKISE